MSHHVIPLRVETLHPQQLVQYYLMCSYLYYQVNISPVPDAAFDKLCVRLDQEWDTITHRHKALIDRAALKAGTGYQIEEYPLWVKCAADRWYFIDNAPRRVRPGPRPLDQSRTGKAPVSADTAECSATTERTPARPVHEMSIDEILRAVAAKVKKL